MNPRAYPSGWLTDTSNQARESSPRVIALFVNCIIIICKIKQIIRYEASKISTSPCFYKKGYVFDSGFSLRSHKIGVVLGPKFQGKGG